MATPGPSGQQSKVGVLGPQFFDLFLDVPHPAASPHSRPSYTIGTPTAEVHHDSIEQELSKSIPQIARFAFPEYDQDSNPAPSPPEQAPPINRFDQYAMQPPSFQNYTFSLTIQSGMRVHGHVRRYLPCHVGATSRYDVGRRGERALVILTRVTGADGIYSAVLKTVDAITSHQLASPHHFPQDQPQKVFLHNLFRRHQHLAQLYVSKPVEARNEPVLLAMVDLEVGLDGCQKFSSVDTTHFLLTPPLLARTSTGDLVSNTSNTSILPVLRCLGVAHTLRLLCALLCERRVILISASPTRLATCCKAAVAILAQGMLHWQHLYIPVLPPHLWQYLAAPYPYLIGILASLTPRLDRTDGLGEVLIINLDHNTMETRGIPTDKIQERIPDLLRNTNADYPMQLGAGNAPPSAPELLAQDLVELMKNDKRTLNGESALASMQDTAVKATKAVKATFFKLKERSQKFLQSKAVSYNENDSKEDDSDPGEPMEVNPMTPDFIYTEGCRNEMGEEEARLAFCTFFVSMVGNMRWYLSAPPGQQPQLDRKLFLQQKSAAGEGELSTMWPLLQNFCHTQMLEEFAKLRLEEMRRRQPVTLDSPLFLQCSNYHHQQRIDFTLLNVRRVSRQVLQANPSRMRHQTNARRIAMELTSKRLFEGDYNKSLAGLVEQCRESSSVLFDVMSVVWIRMRDNRGLQWRHATNSLHILKNLLFHGPLAAVAEATDGLDKIRALKYYNGNRQTAICVQIRASATQVYSLLVDRAKLFQIRRVCISKRRSLKKQNQRGLKRDTRLLQGISVPFQKVHAAMHPNSPHVTSNVPQTPLPSGPPPLLAYNATPTFAVLPPQPQQVSLPIPPSQQGGHDLLGLQQPMQAQVSPASSAYADVFGMFGGRPQHHPAGSAPGANATDVLGLFGDMTPCSFGGAPAPPRAPPRQPTVANPFGPGIAAQQGLLSETIQQQQQLLQLRSQNPSPVPVRGQSLSPTPPQFGQQRPHDPYGIIPATVQRAATFLQPHRRSLSPVPQINQLPSPATLGHHQAEAYNPAGYDGEGLVPAFAQQPSHAQGEYGADQPHHPQGYRLSQAAPNPFEGYQVHAPQQVHPHQQQQRQFQQPGHYHGVQTPPQQQGPFF